MAISIIGLAILLLPIIAGVTAIVTGVMARQRIARAGGALKGAGMALAGILCGALCLLIAAGLTAVVAVMIPQMNRGGRPAGPVRAVRGIPAPVLPGGDVDDDTLEETEGSNDGADGLEDDE